MINARQLQHYIVRPVLLGLDMYSPAAEKLVLGTIACESELGTYIKQRGDGPALGIAQMEPATAHWLVFDYIASRTELAERFEAVTGYEIDLLTPGELDILLICDLRIAVALCRFRYWVVPAALPAVADTDALANYYKQHYNTTSGAATPGRFVEWLSRSGVAALYA